MKKGSIKAFPCSIKTYGEFFVCQQRFFLSADDLCKQFGPRSRLTKVRSCSGYLQFDIDSDLEVFEKVNHDKKIMKNYPACKVLSQVPLSC